MRAPVIPIPGGDCTGSGIAGSEPIAFRTPVIPTAGTGLATGGAEPGLNNKTSL